MGWMVNTTPRPPYLQEGDLVPVLEKAEWATSAVWTGVKNLALIGIRSQERPARDESLYRHAVPTHDLFLIPIPNYQDTLYFRRPCELHVEFNIAEKKL
jgi:hypothetical protein